LLVVNQCSKFRLSVLDDELLLRIQLDNGVLPRHSELLNAHSIFRQSSHRCLVVLVEGDVHGWIGVIGPGSEGLLHEGDVGLEIFYEIEDGDEVLAIADDLGHCLLADFAGEQTGVKRSPILALSLHLGDPHVHPILKAADVYRSNALLALAGVDHPVLFRVLLVVADAADGCLSGRLGRTGHCHELAILALEGRQGINIINFLLLKGVDVLLLVWCVLYLYQLVFRPAQL
jgi:hypothetical protein